MKLSELISKDIPLKRKGTSGRYWIGVTHDSLVVDDKRGKFNWHSRSQWGDAVDWLKFWRNLDEKEARALATETLDRVAYEPVPLNVEKIERYCANLHRQPALDFLHQRYGISLDNARWHLLGYTPGKIVIPNYSRGGLLLSVRYRLMNPRQGYLGNSEQHVGNKEMRYFSEPGSQFTRPYGLWLLPKEGDLLFICEGEFKAIVVAQLGYKSLGTQGTSFSSSWLEYLEGWKRVVYLRDTRDLGGIVSASRMKKIYPRIEIERIPGKHKAIDDLWVADPAKCCSFLEEISSGQRRSSNQANAVVPTEVLAQPRAT